MMTVISTTVTIHEPRTGAIVLFEYKVVITKHTLSESSLNEIGSNGWELVAVLRVNMVPPGITGGGYDGFQYIFKHVKADFIHD